MVPERGPELVEREGWTQEAMSTPYELGQLRIINLIQELCDAVEPFCAIEERAGYSLGVVTTEDVYRLREAHERMVSAITQLGYRKH